MRSHGCCRAPSGARSRPSASPSATGCSIGRTTRGRPAPRGSRCPPCSPRAITRRFAAGASSRRSGAPGSAGRSSSSGAGCRARSAGCSMNSSARRAKARRRRATTDDPRVEERAMNKIIRELNAERASRKVPDFNPGDTVVVQVKVVEGDRERVQAYEGVVIAKKNRGLNSSFTVRKISHGEGVERVFQTYSPSISEVSVKRRGAVRRAKLYYLRDLSGKAARIDEKV